jgi:flagellar protein FlaG
MDIKVVSQSSRAATAPDAAHAPVARGPQADSRSQVDGAGKRVMERATEVAAQDLAEAIAALKGPEIPRLTLVRAELNVDEASRRVFARIFDRATGELVRQIPVEDALRLWGISRKQLGRIVKADV